MPSLLPRRPCCRTRQHERLHQVPFTTPPSNTFIDNPALAMDAVSDTVTIRFSASKVGKVWCMVAEVEDKPYLTSFQIKKKSSDFRVGDHDYCSVLMGSITAANAAATCTLTKCNLDAEQLYVGVVYVEDYLGGMDTSTGMAGFVPITIVPSNGFVFNPSLIAGVEPTIDGLGVEFTTSKDQGAVWGMVVEAGQADAVDRDAVLSFANAMGGLNCRIDRHLLDGDPTVIKSLSGCKFGYARTYRGCFYVEGPGLNRDGSLSCSLGFSLTTSNAFTVEPVVLSNRGRLSVDQLQVRFRTVEQGKFWVKIFVGRNAMADVTSMRRVEDIDYSPYVVKAGMTRTPSTAEAARVAAATESGWILEAPCRFVDETIDNNLPMYILKNCQLW